MYVESLINKLYIPFSGIFWQGKISATSQFRRLSMSYVTLDKTFYHSQSDMKSRNKKTICYQ